MHVYNIYDTFKARALWKNCRVWVSSAPRQEGPSMLFKFTKIILVNIWILDKVPCRFIRQHCSLSPPPPPPYKRVKYLIAVFDTILSHDQLVCSWTHDHTPANPTISYPGMVYTSKIFHKMPWSLEAALMSLLNLRSPRQQCCHVSSSKQNMAGNERVDNSALYVFVYRWYLFRN